MLIVSYVQVAFTYSRYVQQQSAPASTPETKPDPKLKKEKNHPCPNCAPPGDQEIYMPLIDLPESQGSEMVFNSRSPKTVTVTPTFFRRDGLVLVCNPVEVQSTEIRYADIKQLLPEQYRREHNWGGFSLSYYGSNREIWSQFRFLRVNGGSNVDEFFTVKGESQAQELQAAWWAPELSESILALGNISDTATSATLDFGDNSVRSVYLQPHATEIVHNKTKSGQTAQSVVINVTGAAGSIVPTGLITTKDGRYNSVIRFYNPQSAKQPNLYANGFRLAHVTPHMVLRNTTDAPLAATPKFIPLSGAAANPVVSSEIILAPMKQRKWI